MASLLNGRKDGISTLVGCTARDRAASTSGRSIVRQHAGSRQTTRRRDVVVNTAQPPAVSIQSAKVAEASQGEKYDVYVDEPRPLAEGVSKHVISIFVADEPGLINRVAGVFGRRGANIESLAVGLTVDKALFTIVVTGTSTTVSNLVKQLSKLVKVRYVEDITRVNRIERELLLVKVAAPPGAARTEVLQIAQIFRARTVDVSDRTLTLCVSGDTGKCLALQRTLGKFTIVEIVRTGRVSLLRGEKLLEKLQSTENLRRASPPVVAANAVPVSFRSRDADVYMVDSDEQWDAKNNVLEPTYTTQHDPDAASHTLTIEVMDTPGVLNQVTGVFARRGYNVQSLAVGPSERSGMSRITMVVSGSNTSVAKLVNQLNHLVSVQQVQDLTGAPYVQRELLLVKVRCSPSQRGELRDLVEIFRGSVIDVSAYTVTIEVVGKDDKMKALTDLLEPQFGIMEIARTGRVATSRDSRVNSEYLERMSTGRIW